MISPERLTKFDRTQSELELLLIFAVAVAGKNAKTTAKAIERIFEGLDLIGNTPTHYIRNWFVAGGELLVSAKLKRARTGNYKRMTKFFRELVDSYVTLESLDVETLRKFHGISFKTAKMIVLHSKPGERHAVIDTHILKFLRDVVKVQDVPKSTPTSRKKYEMLEEAFLKWVDERIRYQKHICIPKPGGEGLMDRCVVIERDSLTGLANYAKLDLDLWKVYSGNGRA